MRVPAPAVNKIDSVVSGTALDLATPAPRGSGTSRTSKPSGAWQLSLNESAQRVVVRTDSGAEARGRTGAPGPCRGHASRPPLPSRLKSRHAATNNMLTAIGDLAGDGRTDLLARTPAGELGCTPSRRGTAKGRA